MKIPQRLLLTCPGSPQNPQGFVVQIPYFRSQRIVAVCLERGLGLFRGARIVKVPGRSLGGFVKVAQGSSKVVV